MIKALFLTFIVSALSLPAKVDELFVEKAENVPCSPTTYCPDGDICCTACNGCCPDDTTCDCAGGTCDSATGANTTMKAFVKLLQEPVKPTRREVKMISATTGKKSAMSSTLNAASAGLNPCTRYGIMDTWQTRAFCVPWHLRQHTNFESGHLGVNLVYIKVPKAASSTTGGILRRIAAHNGVSGIHNNLWNENITTPEPALWANHLDYRNVAMRLQLLHLKLPVVLVGSVREPSTRAMSEFYHFQCRQKGLPTDNGTKLAFLRRLGNVQHDYLGGGTISDVIQRYDVILSADQLEKSTILLADYLGIPIRDVLFATAKNYSSAKEKDSCAHVPIDEEMADVRKFLSGPFHDANALDRQLVSAVNAQITARFMSDRSLVERLRVFQSSQVTASQCDATLLPGCYWGDNGCGYRCFDQLAACTCLTAHSVM